MKLLTAILPFFFLIISGYAQSIPATESSLACQKNWTYLNLDRDIKGTIIYYEQPVIDCGLMSNASVALIKTEKGDTLRILTLCNVKKAFKIRSEFDAGYKVYVRAVTKPPYRVNLIPVDPMVCLIKEAYFGIVQFNPNQARVIK